MVGSRRQKRVRFCRGVAASQDFAISYLGARNPERSLLGRAPSGSHHRQWPHSSAFPLRGPDLPFASWLDCNPQRDQIPEGVAVCGSHNARQVCSASGKSEILLALVARANRSVNRIQEMTRLPVALISKRSNATEHYCVETHDGLDWAADRR